jgi:predicted MFS family arabinose efflux permease
VPDLIARHSSLSAEDTQRGVFLLYALIGAIVLWQYRQLTPAIEPEFRANRPLGESRPLVIRLAAVFCIDALGGGFVVQSLLALWLYRKFGLSTGTAGAIFFWTGLLSGISALVAVRIAGRIGLVRTMVFTHLPSNVLLIMTALMPNLGLAVTCLMLRSALSQMDVPTRTSYVMAIVSPAERPAAASITQVPRSLASAAPPLLAGWMLDNSTYGWPLIAGGLLKIVYDLTLLGLFRNVRPPEER